MTAAFVDRYLAELEQVLRRLSRHEIAAVVDRLLAAWKEERTIFLIGNGGSAATASHLMNDLNKYTQVAGQSRVRALALTDNVPLMTAIANDLGYQHVFVEPLRNLLRAGDVVVAVSTSGNSPNIVAAAEFAKSAGATVIGLCGNPGSRLAELADPKIIVQSYRVGQQEDVHLILNHVIAEALRQRIADCAHAVV